MSFLYFWVAQLFAEDWELYEAYEKAAGIVTLAVLCFLMFCEVAVEGYLAFYLIGW